MILTLDVGNTNMTGGVFRDDNILATFRMTTKIPRTSDEYAMVLFNLLNQNRIDPKEIKDAIICSVVPDVMHSLASAIIKYLDIKPIIVGANLETGLRIELPNPKQVGADRIVDAVAAYEIYGGPVLVMDYGTATTYDLVNGDGVFVGGITAPGIAISAKALWEDAAKLPKIEIAKPERVIGNDTISSMQSGLVYGQIGQAEYLIKKVKEESGLENLKVVATGGLGRIISESTDAIDVYDANLTLKGIYLVYKKQNRRTK
jgi:type III pantothenate kinase